MTSSVITSGSRNRNCLVSELLGLTAASTGFYSFCWLCGLLKVSPYSLTPSTNDAAVAASPSFALQSHLRMELASWWYQVWSRKKRKKDILFYWVGERENMNTKTPLAHVDSAWVTAEFRSLIALLSPYPGWTSHRKNRFSHSWMAGSWCKICPDRKASLWAYLQGAGTLMVPGQFQYMWHSLKVNLQAKKKIGSLWLHLQFGAWLCTYWVHTFQPSGGLRNTWHNF